MALIDQEKLDALKSNFPYVTILVLCYVVINLFRQNGELYKENTRLQEQRIRDANERSQQERDDKKRYLELYFDYVNSQRK